MPEFTRAGTDRINAFEVEGTYLFKHYFEDEEIFAELKEHYNQYEYRFEVPAFRFEDVQALLRRHGYDLAVVDDVTPFTVVKRKYTNHPEILFEGAVLHRDLGNFNCFVMKDRSTVQQAVAQGARQLGDTDLEAPI
ncbi:MAG: hypothetical protein ABEI52_03815 [Halobacteriaceae archaeon]